jgi:Uma2 family endonuclease
LLLDGNALITPSLLVELTSRSTEDYDRGERLSHYQRLPSVSADLFIAHREPRVTMVERAIVDGPSVSSARETGSPSPSRP